MTTESTSDGLIFRLMIVVGIAAMIFALILWSWQVFIWMDSSTWMRMRLDTAWYWLGFATPEIKRVWLALAVDWLFRQNLCLVLLTVGFVVTWAGKVCLGDEA